MAPRSRRLRRRGSARTGRFGQLARAAAYLGLAESALAAPFAGFGGEGAYPTLELKAAVLLERLVRNHPLPDGNKRTAFILMLTFLEHNGVAWSPPDVELDGQMVERVAAGEAELEEIVTGSKSGQARQIDPASWDWANESGSLARRGVRSVHGAHLSIAWA